MFFDELDAIGRRRGMDVGSGASDRILNTFLTQLDGIIQRSNLVVMAATNRPGILDEGLTRPGRFDTKIEIPTPGHQTSGAVLKHYLKGRPLAGDPKQLDLMVTPLLISIFSPNGQYSKVAEVKLSDGRHLPVPGRDLLSGAMLKNVVNVAARGAALRETESGTRGIRSDDLSSALDAEFQSVVRMLTPGNVKYYVRSIPRDAQTINVEPMPRGVAPFIRSTL